MTVVDKRIADAIMKKVVSGHKRLYHPGRTVVAPVGPVLGGIAVDIAVQEVLQASGRSIERVGTVLFPQLLKDVKELVSLQPVQFRLKVSFAGGYYQLTGEMEARGELSCAKCLQVFSFHLQIPIQETMTEKEELSEEEERQDILQIADGVIHLNPLLESLLILHLPYVPQCREDCQGLCPHCGVNLNHQSCDCRKEKVDIRWAPLEKLFSSQDDQK